MRIIAATNVSLEDAVTAGSFRNDLYYRLNVVPILLPPLRERRDDIPLLLDHFLRISNRRNEKKIRMSIDFLDFITSYSWPGNVRELQNLVERLVILSTNDVLRSEDLPEYIIHPPAGKTADNNKPILSPAPADDKSDNMETVSSRHRSLEEVEREKVKDALIRHGWVQARAARELGLTQRQIGYRMKKFGLNRPEIL